jgi:hypothetical protein
MTDAPCGTDCHYLEWAPSTWGGENWNKTFLVDDADYFGGGTSSNFGSGYKNTVLLSSSNGNFTSNSADASRTVRAYSGGGMTDWFIPSRAELVEMSNSTQYSSGGFTTSGDRFYYWTSTASEPQAGNSLFLHGISNTDRSFAGDPGAQPAYRNGFSLRPIRAG